jgi:hypothetical protein
MVLFPIARAVQIARQKLYGESDVVASMLSIMSMVGITVARFRVPREKKSVVSLKI